MDFARYAIFYVPAAADAWAQYCTGWLGWDSIAGAKVAFPGIDNLAEATQTPRKYGLHATLKPPFRLAPNETQSDLETACLALAADQSPVQLHALRLTRLGRFLALCPPGPTGPPAAIDTLAARCVSDLDQFRAPLTDNEMARRRGKGLSKQHETNLVRWGYPHVMDAYRFHITLTGRLSKPSLTTLEDRLNADLGPLLPSPLTVSDLALLGEDQSGRFHLIQRFAFRRRP